MDPVMFWSGVGDYYSKGPFPLQSLFNPLFNVFLTTHTMCHTGMIFALLPLLTNLVLNSSIICVYPHSHAVSS